MNEPCCRLDCQEPAEAQVTLKMGQTESKVYYLCLFHYHEVLTVAQGMRILTGMPEIREERDEYRHEATNNH